MEFYTLPNVHVCRSDLFRMPYIFSYEEACALLSYRVCTIKLDGGNNGTRTSTMIGINILKLTIWHLFETNPITSAVPRGIAVECRQFTRRKAPF